MTTRARSSTFDRPPTRENFEHICSNARGGDRCDTCFRPLHPTSAGNSDAVTGAVTAPRRLLGTLSSAERKEYPVTSGVLDYFPDALALVAHVSYMGNQKHNPGQPLHWARAKSTDHADCIGRHLIERDGMDGDMLHAAALAWRALADLQLLAEKQFNLSPPRNARDG